MLLYKVLLSSVFSVLASLCAFIITYGEYLKHYPDKRRPFLVAAKAALAAFVFFMIASLGLLTLFPPF